MTPHTIKWQPSNDNIVYPIDARHPAGMIIDLSYGKPSCEFKLPYPAPGNGQWQVRCTQCKRMNNIRASGRVDDPCSYRIDCRAVKQEQQHRQLVLI